MIKALHFAFLAFRCYRRASNNRMHYGAITNDFGIPEVTLIVATGREAWRVSNYAFNLKEL